MGCLGEMLDVTKCVELETVTLACTTILLMAFPVVLAARGLVIHQVLLISIFCFMFS